MNLQSFNLISWNVAGRVRKCSLQLEMILEYTPDLLALQEVRQGSLEIWQKGLEGAGYNVEETITSSTTNRRKLGVLTASKFTIEKLSSRINIPFPERFLSVEISLPTERIKLHNCHIPPGSSNGWKKIETFESVFRLLAKKTGESRILCGDFNSPQTELPDGTIVTWGQKIKSDGSIILHRKYERWDKGERSVIDKLREYDLGDVYRTLHGYEKQEFSWYLERKGKVVAKRRFDHVFASSKLNPVRCYYIHEVRRMGLSDHSAIYATFEPKVCKN